MRLTKIGYKAGLVTKERYDYVVWKQETINKEIQRLENTKVGASKEIQDFLEKSGSTTLKTAATLAELIRRPELTYEMIAEIDKDREELPYDVVEQVNIEIKYEGYISRQLSQVQQFKKLENKKLDAQFDYSVVPSLRKEAIQKLNMYKPLSIGQASRISGVSPADISVLLVFLEQTRRKSTVSAETEE